MRRASITVAVLLLLDAYLYLDPGDGGKEIPIVAADVREAEGYTLSAPLPEEVMSRVKPGMAVRRK